MEFLRKILNRETISYMIFGGLTTLVNYVTFLLFYELLFGRQLSLVANAVAFIISVIFSFFANKLFVFTSKSWAPKVLLREMTTFGMSRLASFCVEEAGLFFCESVLRWNTKTFMLGSIAVDGITAAKLGLSVSVVVMNYAFCKLFVFKNRG